jgi:hypothetical protein
LGLKIDDDGSWMREQFLIMAENTHTPIPFWMALPLKEFRRWIDAHNKVQKKRRQELEKARKKR